MDNKTKFHVKEDEGPLTLRFMFSNLPPGNLSATCKTIDNTASKFLITGWNFALSIIP